MNIPSGLLKVGSRGKPVEDLQRELTSAGYSTGGVDGDFGPKTQAALERFQSAKHIAVDGIAGRQTWTALGGDRFESKGSSGSGSVGKPSTAGGKSVTAYYNGSPRTITVVPVGNGQYLRADAAASYKKMVAAAARAGIHLSADSGFRSMAEQQHLYQLYLEGRGNLAAKPGYSNHQGGVAMDIGGVNGYGTAAYNWLRAHAGDYGFRNTVSGEYWHWSYGVNG